MEQTKALNALEPFLALSKSATSPRAAADLITRATSNPNTYVFTELLETPQIQALASSDLHSHLTLLELFSHGTYADYLAAAAAAAGNNLPELNPAQTLKLRQLTLLTLAHTRSNLSYAALQSALDLPSARILEDLVISAIYAGLVDAKLDPARQVVQVDGLAPLRDLAPGAVPNMIKALHAWSARCESTLDDLEAQIAGIRNAAAKRQAEKATREARLSKLVDETRKEPDAGSRKLAIGHGHGGGERGSGFLGHTSRASRYNKRGSTSMMDNTEEVDDEAMDVDEEDDEQEKKRASRRKL
ncbi:COP9 signalosome complex subunit 7a [Colletotrichum sidae]|uniref:COP9 signalosome complex subunit 7a n=2 Tax=Colletotrichum orbiculare species complex TaxID=2707354 RepID=A0A4R8RM64_COLTR|nr:COP9 signalosome complex subunit 7a [Colletotrichum trifolii]TEA13711.1 COP9 signalosome complex subunit 7a [Colletotrichum sidae]